MPPSLSECNKITPTAHRTFGWIIEFILVGHFFTKSQLRTFRHNALRLAHEMRHNSQIQALEWVSHHLLAPFIDQAELLINTMWCVMCWIVKKRELRLRSLGRKTTRLSPHTYIAQLMTLETNMKICCLYCGFFYPVRTNQTPGWCCRVNPNESRS